MKTPVKPVEYPTVPNTTIKVGDRVRSFDFPDNAQCYWVGTVESILPATQQYRVKVEYQVWENERESDNYCDAVCPPINGLRGIFGPTRGVQRIVEGEEA